MVPQRRWPGSATQTRGIQKGLDRSVKQLALPRERIADDPINVRIVWSPAERVEEPLVARNERGWVAGPAAFHDSFERRAACLVDGVEHFEDRQAPAVAAVNHEVFLRVLSQPLEHGHVRGGEVADMDIIADARSV